MQKNQEINIKSVFNELIQIEHNLSLSVKDALNTIAMSGENSKGVLTVIMTGLIYKYYHPNQDVRNHQQGMDGGYSGRSFDTKYITPFMKESGFPAMSESGWLTRSLEQSHPYNMEYPGKISGKGIKQAFLKIYDASKNQDCVINMLSFLFEKLVEIREFKNFKLFKPANLTIEKTRNLIKSHISFKYKNVSGASRLPNIAIYAAYKAMLNNCGRYENRILCKLKSHTASDERTGAIGDIQINNKDGEPFEGIEIKTEKITINMVNTIYSKIKKYTAVSRYYLLTTDDDFSFDAHGDINRKIFEIYSCHGCDVIINGVYRTLKYFLRLSDTESFIDSYVDQLEKDEVIKYEHRQAWNKLCGTLLK